MQKPVAAGLMPPDEAWQQPALLDVCVASPPWQDQLVNHHTPAQYQALKDKVARDGKGHGGAVGASVGQGYGQSPGQLGAMPAGSVDACLASPPYAEGLGHARGTVADAKEWTEKSIGSTRYGTHPAQLGNMPAGTPPEDPACYRCSALLLEI